MKDRLKEEISWLRNIFNLLTLIDISLIGWLALNYDHGKKFLVIFSGFIILIVTVIIVNLFLKINKKIGEL